MLHPPGDDRRPQWNAAMKKLIVIAGLGFACWHLYLKPPASPVITNIGSDGAVLSNPIIEQPAPAFHSTVSLVATRGIESLVPA